MTEIPWGQDGSNQFVRSEMFIKIPTKWFQPVSAAWWPGLIDFRFSLRCNGRLTAHRRRLVSSWQMSSPEVRTIVISDLHIRKFWSYGGNGDCQFATKWHWRENSYASNPLLIPIFCCVNMRLIRMAAIHGGHEPRTKYVAWQNLASNLQNFATRLFAYQDCMGKRCWPLEDVKWSGLG